MCVGLDMCVCVCVHMSTPVRSSLRVLVHTQSWAAGLSPVASAEWRKQHKLAFPSNPKKKSSIGTKNCIFHSVSIMNKCMLCFVMFYNKLVIKGKYLFPTRIVISWSHNLPSKVFFHEQSVRPQAKKPIIPSNTTQ